MFKILKESLDERHQKLNQAPTIGNKTEHQLKADLLLLEDSKDPQDCSFCKKSGAKLFCTACYFAYYCSDTCQKAHWGVAHEDACKGPLRFMRGDMTAKQWDEHSAIKVISRSSKWGIKTVVRLDCKAGQMIAFFKPLIYLMNYTNTELKSMEVLNIYVRNRQKTEPQALLTDNEFFFPAGKYEAKGLLAGLTTILLKKFDSYLRSHLFETGIVQDKESTDDINALIKHFIDPSEKKEDAAWTDIDIKEIYLMMRKNAVFVTNEVLPKKITAALFSPHLACINHSCSPNVRFVFCPDSRDIKLIALRDIKKDEQLFLDYLGGASEISGWSERRELLYRIYGFHCRCSRCIQNAIDRPLSIESRFVPDEDDYSMKKLDPEDERKKRFIHAQNNSVYRNRFIPKELQQEYHFDSVLLEPSCAKGIILRLERDEFLQHYLFKKNVQLFASLISDLVAYETTRLIQQALFSQREEPPPDEFDKKENLLNAVPRYIRVLDMFFESLQRRGKEQKYVQFCTKLRLIHLTLLLRPYKNFSELTGEQKESFERDLEWYKQHYEQRLSSVHPVCSMREMLTLDFLLNPLLFGNIFREFLK